MNFEPRYSFGRNQSNKSSLQNLNDFQHGPEDIKSKHPTLPCYG